MRRLVAPIVVMALAGAVGCGEQTTVSDTEIIRALDLQSDVEEPVYAMGGDEFCQVEQGLLNDADEVEEAKSSDALVITDSQEDVGIEVVPPFDPACEQDARKALNKLTKKE